MRDDELVSNLMMYLSTSQAASQEIKDMFGPDCAANHAHLARSYYEKLLELGVDPRLLVPLTSPQ